MKRVWGIALLTIGVWARADIGAEIDRLFRDYDRPGVPGAAVVAIADGEVVHRRGYGLAERETSRAVSERTNFRTASVSKQFTAMAILALIDRGRLDEEETLADIFPDFPAYGARIRVRHLLHHTSGLRDYEDLIPSSQTTQVSDADVLGMMKRQSSTLFTPGTRYRYSNSGYCVLAQIVERRAEMPYQTFVRENIFVPLGMDGSRVYSRDEPPEIPERAYGYTPSGAGFKRTDQSPTSATQGDGGVYTSVVDYTKWILGHRLLVSEPLLERMFTKGKLDDGTEIAYGYGWVIDSAQGRRRYSHTGSSIGFRTAVEIFPDESVAVAVLVNRAGASPWEIARRITDLLLARARD